MILSSGEVPTVGIAQARKFDKNKEFFSRHAPLARRLAHYGANAIALNGAADRISNGQFSAYYRFDQPNSDLEFAHGPVTVDAAFDLSGGIARYVPEVAALNPLGVREIALSKQRQHDVLRPVLGDAVPVTVSAPAEVNAIIAALGEIESPEVVVKFERDYDKKYGALIGGKATVKAELEKYLEGSDPLKDTAVVQEYMPETRADFASGIKLFDQVEKDLADSLRNYYQRELRVHMIDDTAILVSARSGLDAKHCSPNDKILFLDPESIPEHVIAIAQTAAQSIRLAAGNAQDSYVTVDTTPDGRRIGEINGRNIWTTRPDPTRPGANYAHAVVTDRLAVKLHTMATRGRTV